MKVVRNPEGKFRHVQMSSAEYAESSEAYEGVCVACGATQGGCEPDARKYRCEACGKHAVYGLEELMLVSRVRLTN